MKKKLTFILFLLSFSLAYGQSSIGENPYFYMLVTKSMEMKTGKIDFVEHKQVKGSKKPLITYYSLIFAKDIFYKTENKKINIHFFNEQDSILYLVDDHASYLIDYKKKEVVINEKDELIFLMRKNHPFASFYSNQTGGDLLLMGRVRDSTKTDFSTIISFAQQKIFTEMYNLQTKISLLDKRLFCYDKYEFRNADTLLIQYVSKISNPYNYEKGTIIEFDTKLLYAVLDDQEYEKPDYYNYEKFCNDDFHFYDKRKSLVVDEYIYHDHNLERNDKAALQSLIAENKADDIYSSHFLELENGMMALYMQVKEGQQQIAAQKKEWQEITDNRIFNMNLYPLPAKSIPTISSDEIAMVDISFTIPIPLDTAEIISDEYLVENQEGEKTIIKEMYILSDNTQNIHSDTVILSTKIKSEDFLSEEFKDESFLDIATVELEVEEIFEEDFIKEDIVDPILPEAEIENIIFEKIISGKDREEKFAEIIILESETKDIFIREIPIEDFVEDRDIDVVFSDEELGTIFVGDTIKEIFIKEKIADVILPDTEVDPIAFEEVASEELLEKELIKTIPELESVFREDTFSENRIANIVHSDTVIKDIVVAEIIPDEITEEKFADTVASELEIKAFFVEEVVLEEPIKNEIIDSVFLNIIAEFVGNKKTTDTVATELFVKTDILEIDSTILIKDKLHMDTIASISLANKIMEDTLSITKDKEIVSDLLETPVIVENVKVEVIYLDSSSGGNQVSETLEDGLLYYIVLNYFKDMENAKAFFDDRKKLFDNLLHLGKDASSGTYMVGMGPYKTENEAQDTLDNMWVNNVKGWIIRQ